MEESQEQLVGTPARQQQIKLAKEKSKAKKLNKYEKELFTLRKGKVLQVIAKPHGATTTLVGRNNDQNKELFKTSIAQWKKDGLWVSEEDAEEKIHEAVLAMQALKDEDDKKKA